MAKSIYRFRGIDGNTIKALENDEIYGISPVMFNDPYDCLFRFNQYKLFNLLMKDNDLVNHFANDVYEWFKVELPENTFDDAIEFVKNYVLYGGKANNLALSVMDVFRKQVLISCFCHSIVKEIMWSHYASLSKGFALEYDEDDIKKMKDEYLSNYKLIYPNDYSDEQLKMFGLYNVEYDNNRFDGTITTLNIVKQDITNKNVEGSSFKEKRLFVNNSEFRNIFLNKNPDCQYEDEIRLILPNMNLNKSFTLLGKVKPKGIYMGEFIDDKDRENLCKIAKGKGIPIYQMITILDTKQFGLDVRKLSDEEVDRVINKAKVNFYN